MRMIAALAVFLFSSICFASPQLIFSIHKEAGELRIVSAGRAPEAQFAYPLKSFLGKSIAEGFSPFGKEITLSVEKLVNETLNGKEETRKLEYTNPVDNKPYIAEFMKMFDDNGDASVDILIYPRS